MKKSLLLLVMLLCSIGQGVAQTLIDGIYYDLLYSEGGTALVAHVPSGVPKYSGNISIPSMVTYEGIPFSVTSIKAMAFSGCSGLTSIEIPNSVTAIGDLAFSDCTGLTSIEIPNSVTYIGFAAFDCCTGLTSIEIPNSVASIREGTFGGCTGLTSVSIGNSVTNIGDGAFSGCTGLTSIKIPNSVTSIDGSAFGRCSGLTSIVVEAGNTYYDSRNTCNAIIETSTSTLISGCMNTVIPNSVTSIGKSAFSGCTGLTSIEIPNSVASIGGGAFSGCTGLTSVSIGNYVTSIGDGAFSGCTGLTSIKIPNSVTSIGYRVFGGCSGLTSIVVEAGNTYYDSRSTCNAIIETSTGALIAGCMNTVIPNSVTSIGDGAFSSCKGLTSITIPNSVASIGYFAFGYCSGLTDIKMMSATPPTTGGNLFADCTNLTTIYVPKGAKEAYNVEPWNSYEIVEMDDTGIAAAPTIDNQTVAAPVYDLNGRCVGTTNAISTLPKGVYIVNGKKILR